MKILFPLLIVFLGFALARLIDRLDDRTLAIVCVFAFAPAFLFRQGLGQPVSEHEFTMLFFYMLFHSGLLYILVSQLLYWLNTPTRTRHLYLLNILLVNMFTLRGVQPFIGEPSQAVQSTQILIFYHLILFSVFGVYLCVEKERIGQDVLKIFLTPLPYALLLGVVLSSNEVTLPFEIMTVIESLLNTTMNLALLIVGIIVGRYVFMMRAQEYLMLLGGIVFCLICRLLLSPALAIGITYLMGFDDTAMQRSAILAAGAPTGTLGAVLICFYGSNKEKRFTALCIVVSSLISFITLPLLLMLLNLFLPIENY